MAKKLLIIGGGVAGLSAGIYGRMNGYDTEIFEMHTIPGGVCTAWKRGDYLFDGCIHWLVGSKPGNAFHAVWRELGVLKERRVYDHEQFVEMHIGGTVVHFYNDADRLEKHLLELAPEDEKEIRRLCRLIRKFSAFEPDLTPTDLYGPGDWLKYALTMFPFLGDIMKLLSTPLVDYARRFRNPTLRSALEHLFPIKGFAAAFFIVTMGWMHRKTAGVPEGGSLPFALNLKERYESLGGKLHLGKKVAKITVENGTAVGIELADGTTRRGDTVISAADGRSTLFDMLGDRYLTPKLRAYYADPVLFPPTLQISLGLKRDLSGDPHTIARVLDQPVIIGGLPQPAVTVQNYSFDPSFAPAGKSVIVCYLFTDYDRWEKLYTTDRTAYEKEKMKAADDLIALLERWYPGIGGEVEVRDVATPMTYVRYTANWRGAWEGWAPTTKTFKWKIPTELPGLRDFHMIGQWTTPGGGLPPAALSGRQLIQRLCDRDEKPFTTTEA